MEREHLASLIGDMRRRGRETAVVEHRGVRHLRTSYGEIAEVAGRFAAELRRREIGAGERVALWGVSSAEWMGAFFGCVLRGVIVVPMDAAGAREFVERVIADTKARLVVGDAELLRGLRFDGPGLAFEELRAKLPREPEFAVDAAVTLDAPFQIVFTSGTTSEPKGIVHTHRNVLVSLEPIESEIEKYRRYERIFHPLRFMHTLPLSHVFGQFMGLWIPPVLGAELHFETNLEPSRMVEALKRERINVLIAVPRVMALLRAHLLSDDASLAAEVERVAALPAWKRWWRMRRVHRRLGWRFWALICGGATLPGELESFWRAVGVAVIQGYGMTETAALVTLNHPFKIGRGTLGKPLPGREVKIGEGGEVLVRGAMVSGATWQDGALKPRTDEWLATGDLAAQDESGELRFLGRKGDVIVTAAGMNVHPADLEAELMKQQGVKSAAVVACEAANGQEPVAAVVFNGSDAELGEAVRRANASLAEFQQIRRHVRWPDAALPYTSTGKLLRRQVAAWACAAVRGDGATAKPKEMLLAMIAEVTGEESREAGDEARLSEDLHLDSLARVQLQSLLESRLGVEVSDDAIVQMQTLGELRGLVGAGAAEIAEPSHESSERASPVVVESASAMQVPGVQQVTKEEPLPYLRWPWAWPMQVVRAGFLELIAQPLIWLLAAPRVVFETKKIPEGPMLLIANHVTAYDGPLVMYALPGRVRRRVAVAMSGELLLDLRRGRGQDSAILNVLAPIGYWLITALYNVFPLPRRRGFRRSFAHAGAAMDRGYSVMIFPEGHRSETGKLQRFREGTGLLAKESQVPVLPVALRGLQELKASGRWVRSHPNERVRWGPRSGRLEVRVGAPVELGPEATAAEWTAALEAAVQRLTE
ncbi:MAG TPA: AMP-binding protein [Acidobacteriaceae bacterium]|nr:AMP-binding protein [Acidobacteriaceae bacterium]